MKTVNVTDGAFSEFKAAKVRLQARLGEEMTDSFALSYMVTEYEKNLAKQEA